MTASLDLKRLAGAVLACERLDEFRKNKNHRGQGNESVLTSLAHIPDPVDTGVAGKLLSDLGKVEQDAKSLSEKFLKMTVHTRRMESVPPPLIGTCGQDCLVCYWNSKRRHIPCRTCAAKCVNSCTNWIMCLLAVDEADIKGAHRSLDGLVDAETRRDGLERDFERLVRLGRSLNAVPVDCSVDIEETGVLFQSIQSLTNIRENMRIVSDRQTCLIGNSTKALTELAISTHSLKNCEKELKGVS